jgi:hypothetical protein
MVAKSIVGIYGTS